MSDQYANDVEKYRDLSRRNEEKFKGMATDRDRWRDRAKANLAALEELRRENHALMDRLVRQGTEQ